MGDKEGFEKSGSPACSSDSSELRSSTLEPVEPAPGDSGPGRARRAASQCSEPLLVGGNVQLQRSSRVSWQGREGQRGSERSSVMAGWHRVSRPHCFSSCTVIIHLIFNVSSPGSGSGPGSFRLPNVSALANSSRTSSTNSMIPLLFSSTHQSHCPHRKPFVVSTIECNNARPGAASQTTTLVVGTSSFV